MGKFKLISTNIMTAIITAVLTSAFWMMAYNGPVADGEKWHQGSPINPYPLLAGRSAR